MMMVRPVGADLLDQRNAGPKLGGIETGEPLVEQQRLRVGRERAGELDPFLIDIGERRDRGVVGAAQAQPAAAGRGRSRRARDPNAGCGRTRRRRRRSPAPSATAACERSETCGRCPGRRSRWPAQSGDVLAVEPDCAAVGFSAPEIMFSIVVLPEPFGPISPSTSFFGKLKGHIVDGDETAEALGDAVRRAAPRRQRRVRHCRSSRAETNPSLSPTRRRGRASGLRAVRPRRAE